MSILNVDKIQPIGGGSTITVDATDIQASTGTIRASTFSGDVSATGIGVTSLNVAGVSTFTNELQITTGRLLVNHTSSRVVANVTAQVQLEGTTANTSAISITRNSASEYPPYLNFGKSRASSTGGNTIINNNDSLGEIRFSGADGADLTNHAASINAEVDGTPSSNVTPGRLIFSTTSSTGSDAIERLRIDNNGKLTLSNSEGIQLSAKNSNLYLVDGAISYYGTTNAVYVNGAGVAGWLRLNAAGATNNRTAINIYGHNYSTGDTIDFRTNSLQRLLIGSDANITFTGPSNSFATIQYAANFTKLDLRGNGIANSNHYILSYGEGHANDHEFHMVNTLGALVFRTGSSSPTEKLRIDSSGRSLFITNGSQTSPVADNNVPVQIAESTGDMCYFGANKGNSYGTIFGHHTHYGGTVIRNLTSDNIVFMTNNNQEKLRIAANGHVTPGSNNTQDLGSTAKGWRNIYTNDLNLSNMNGEINDIDGTQGSWTIQEGKDDLYIINRLNGKKFKIKMEEIS